MGQIWVKEFTGGLDTRRMPETTSGGVLIEAQDGHINRGGEFEKRAAFIEAYTLPPGQTTGLGYTRAGLLVFGTDNDVGVPTGMFYQKLAHPDGDQALVRVPSFDLYSGKPYVVGEFEDGSLFHYYAGDRVEDWYDGRARAAFQVTAGANNPAVAAQGAFTITGGTVGGGNQITNVTVDGVAVIAAPVAFVTNATATAAAVASAINSHVSTPNYTATSAGAVVTIIAATAGAAANGRAIVATGGGTVTTGSVQPMAGGADAQASKLTDITVNGVSILTAPVNWNASNTATATAIAAAINANVSVPEYSGSSSGEQVNIIATDAGVAPNGFDVAFTLTDGLQVSPSSDLVMAGGSAAENVYQPGPFVRTIGSKMYATSGPNMHFSGIQMPTQWTTDVIGAGFIDMSSQASGSEELTALAKYQTFVAVFSEENVQIWYVDPNPELNKQSQVLNNTGTASPRSVTQFGDSDLFYLNESGVRSLRARDASNSAATTDIGVPVDELVTDALMQVTDRTRVIGLIEPRDGRFWLIIEDKIFVFSYFSGSKVSAWSTYKPGFVIDDALVFKKRVYLRSGDKIYVYGGLGAELQYDETSALARLPYLNGDSPSRKKDLKGVDAALRGEWSVAVAMSVTDQEAADEIAILPNTTFDEDTIPANGAASHFSLIFRSRGTGPAKLGSAVIHYQSEDDED